MKLKMNSEQNTRCERLLATVHPDLVAAAFSAAAMAALAMHYGTNTTPCIEQHYSTTPGGQLVWEAAQTHLPGYGPLNGIADMSLLKAGFIGTHIGLALQDGGRAGGFFHRARSCRPELAEQYRRYGLRPEQITADYRRGSGDMLALYALLMQYESLIFANAIDLIRAAIQTVGRWPPLALCPSPA